jgi:hypothetical protein
VGLEAVAELVRRAARDTTAVRALADAPDQLAPLIDLSPGELQALRATTSVANSEPRAFAAPSPPSDASTGLLPPQGSGVPAATPIAGITGLPGGPPTPPVGPSAPPAGPGPIGRPTQPPSPPQQPSGPGPAPPQFPAPPPIWPQQPPAPPAPPPLSGEGPAPAPAAPLASPTPPGTCRCQEVAAVAAVAIVANTAISAIAAIAAMPCGGQPDGRPTTNHPCQGGR